MYEMLAAHYDLYVSCKLPRQQPILIIFRFKNFRIVKVSKLFDTFFVE